MIVKLKLKLLLLAIQGSIETTTLLPLPSDLLKTYRDPSVGLSEASELSRKLIEELAKQ